MKTLDLTWRISATQIGFFTATLLFAPFAFTFPRSGMALAPFSGPIVLLVVLSLTLATAWAVTSVAGRFPGEPPGAWMPKMAGPLGTAYTIALAVLAVLLAAAVLRQVAFMVKVEFLEGTPLWAIEGAVALTAAYTGGQGVEGLGRAITLLFSAAWLGFTIAYLLTLTRVYDWSLVVPALPVPLSDLLPFVYQVMILGLGISLLWVYLPYNPDRQKSFRAAAAGITAVFVIMALILVDVLGTFGPFAAAHLTWPPITVMRVASFVGLLIPRLGLFTAVLWPGLAAIQMGTYLLAATLLWRERGPVPPVKKARLLPITLLGAALAFGLAQIPPSDALTHDLIYTYLLPFGALITFAAPWGFWALAALRSRRQSTLF